MNVYKFTKYLDIIPLKSKRHIVPLKIKTYIVLLDASIKMLSKQNAITLLFISSLHGYLFVQNWLSSVVTITSRAMKFGNLVQFNR